MFESSFIDNSFTRLTTNIAKDNLEATATNMISRRCMVHVELPLRPISYHIGKDKLAESIVTKIGMEIMLSLGSDKIEYEEFLAEFQFELSASGHRILETEAIIDTEIFSNLEMVYNHVRKILDTYGDEDYICVGWLIDPILKHSAENTTMSFMAFS